MNIIITLAATLLLSSCMTHSSKSYQTPTKASYFVYTKDVMVRTCDEPQSLIMPNGTRINCGLALNSPARLCFLFIQIGDDSEMLRRQGFWRPISGIAKQEAGRIREFKDDPDCVGFYDYISLQDSNF